MKKRRFRARYIIIPLVGMLALALALTFAVLPPKNLLSVVGDHHVYLPDFLYRFVSGGERDYSTSPDIMTFSDGRRVKTVEDMEKRRQEILSLFEQNVYGPIPQTGFSTGFRILEEGPALGGKATGRQVEVSISTDLGVSKSLMILYLPIADHPVPAIVGINFNGNHTVLDDEMIIPSFSSTTDGKAIEEKRGYRKERWNIENAIDHGYAVASICRDDLAPDNADHYDERLVSIFEDPEFKAISAWAFGIMREIDYLETLDEIDGTRIASIGHSRLGKASLWAGANDERISLVIANGSGHSGASMTRDCRGETLRSINIMFPYWFSSAYHEYSFHEKELPVDQHMLIAAVAPRKIYIGNGYGDLWADTPGSWNAMTLAIPAYEIYGCDAFRDMSLPGKDEHRWTSSMGYHNRLGWHAIGNDDWNLYLEYMDRYL